MSGRRSRPTILAFVVAVLSVAVLVAAAVLSVAVLVVAVLVVVSCGDSSGDGVVAPDEDLPRPGEAGGVGPAGASSDETCDPSLLLHGAGTGFSSLDDPRMIPGTTWSIDGVARGGPDKGVVLEFVASFVTEWYGWAAYHPATSIDGRETADPLEVGRG